MDKSKKNITNRIKTFDDALEELGPNHPLVKEYEAICKADVTENTIVYSRLCVITAAMNEGWRPRFVKEEYRYFPYFYLYTNEEISRMSKEEKSSVVFRSNSSAYAYGGVAYACAYNDSVYVANVGFRLCFKSSERAEQFGKQFADLYNKVFL